MAEYEAYGGDDLFDADYDYLYAEDGYNVADELVENVVASPPAQTYEDFEMNTEDYDPYEYFGDVEYGHDSYWDSNIKHLRDDKPALPGQKRKRPSEVVERQPNKRRKSAKQQKPTPDDSDDDYPKVISKSFEERSKLAQRPPTTERRSSFALLGDWKERFKNDSGDSFGKAMPADMRKAAEEKDQDMPPTKKGLPAGILSPPDGEEQDQEMGEEEGSTVLDPAMLMAVLKQKMGEAGMEGIDEVTFMQTIGKMMSGEADADGAAGDLAGQLLGRATGGDTALSGWLSQQGVDLEEEEEDASSVATTDLPSGPGNQVSPRDSAISVQEEQKETASKKRAAPTDTPANGKKRKTVSFATSEELLPDAAHEAEPGQPVLAVEAHATETENLLTSEDPLTLAENIPKPLPTRERNGSAADKTKAVPKGRKGKAASQLEPSAVNSTETVAKAELPNTKTTRKGKVLKTVPIPSTTAAREDASAKPSRKRKASPDEHQADEGEQPEPKRNTSGFAAPTASSAGRASTGKKK